jgi:Na+/alanine symporter
VKSELTSAVGTLFNPVARIEAIQAMTLLASFSENGWLPGGHAVRMGIDMGINHSFMQLLRTGMGKGKNPQQLAEERHLVVQSRTWFCVSYLLGTLLTCSYTSLSISEYRVWNSTEVRMAYGMGRPAIIREDETIHNCRKLLEHPLSITSEGQLQRGSDSSILIFPGR